MNITSEQLQFVRSSLSKIVKISDLEWRVGESKFCCESLKKGEYFALAGEIPTKIAFVLAGVLRIYFTTEDGKEFTRDFKCTGDLVAAYSGLITNGKSSMSIQARTNVEIAVIPYEKMEWLYSNSNVWQELGRKVAEKKFVELEKREIELATLSAEESYDVFCKRFPGLKKTIPQYEIASYLGISPVSLSRILSKNT